MLVTWKTYAGPEPETPVTASRSDSSCTLSAEPRAPSIEPTIAASAAEHAALQMYPAACSWTTHGVLGMTLAILRSPSDLDRFDPTGGWSQPARDLSVTPAQSET